MERQNETNWCLLGIDSYSFEIWFVKSCFIVSIREQYLCGWCIMHASHLRYCQSKLQARSISDILNFVPTFWMVLPEMVMMFLCLYYFLAPTGPLERLFVCLVQVCLKLSKSWLRSSSRLLSSLMSLSGLTLLVTSLSSLSPQHISSEPKTKYVLILLDIFLKTELVIIISYPDW